MAAEGGRLRIHSGSSAAAATAVQTAKPWKGAAAHPNIFYFNFSHRDTRPKGTPRSPAATAAAAAVAVALAAGLLAAAAAAAVGGRR